MCDMKGPHVVRCSECYVARCTAVTKPNMSHADLGLEQEVVVMLYLVRATVPSPHRVHVVDLVEDHHPRVR